MAVISRVNCSTWPTSASSRLTPPEILLTRSQRVGAVGDVLGQQRGVKLDAAQRVADFVGHARRHLAQGGQAVLPLQQAVLFAQFLRSDCTVRVSWSCDCWSLSVTSL